MLTGSHRFVLPLLPVAALAALLPACRHSGDTSAAPRIDSAALVTVPGRPAELTVIDSYPESEASISGHVKGSFLDTREADGILQAISEGMAPEASPARRHSTLEHHWRLLVAEGSRVELHLRAFCTPSLDGDRFVFEYSTDEGRRWKPVSLPDLPLYAAEGELVAPLPDHLSGEILVRVVDTLREPGLLVYDTLYVDEIFVRSVS